MSFEVKGGLEPPSDADILAMRARADLEAILILRRFPAFQDYFMRRIREKSEPVRDMLLHRRLLLEEHREAQVKLAAFEEILGMLDDDETGNRSILG